MPEIPTKQNADWNADGQPQADAQRDRSHENQPDAERSKESPTEGRDRPPAGSDQKRSPWMGGG